MISKHKLYNDFKELGLKKGDLLNLKISLKAIGKIENGAKSLIDVLLEIVGREGLILTESFVPVKVSAAFFKNHISTHQSKSYAGVIANEILTYPDVIRSAHPVMKYAAIGQKAEYLLLNHNKSSGPYEVLKKLAYLGGKNLRVGGIDKVIGVGTTHAAITALGLKQKIYPAGVWYYEKNQLKKFLINWADGCTGGFNDLIPKYRAIGAILEEGYIGNAPALLTDMKKTYEYEVEMIKKDNTFFMCNDPLCIKCRLSWEFSEKNYKKVLYNLLKNHEYQKILKSLIYPFLKYSSYKG